MCVSPQRFDIQYGVKTLAASLKSPTVAAWHELGSLIGYRKVGECFALFSRESQWRWMALSQSTFSFICSLCASWVGNTQQQPNTEMHSTCCALNQSGMQPVLERGVDFTCIT